MVSWRILVAGIAVAYACAAVVALVPELPPGAGYLAGSLAAGYLAGDSGRGAAYGAAVAVSGALVALAGFLAFQVVALLGAFGSQAAGAAAHALGGVFVMLTIPTLAAVAVAFVIVGGVTLAGLSAVVGAAGGVIAQRLRRTRPAVD